MGSVIRHLLGAVFLAGLVTFVLAVLKAWRDVSILEYPRFIFSDPWATASFVDAVAGLPLILTHVWSTSAHPAAATAWTIGILGLGNAITMMYGMWRVWTHTTVTQAFLPQSAPPGSVPVPGGVGGVGTPSAHGAEPGGGVRALQLLTGLALALYALFGIRALLIENPSVGWAYVTRNGWPRVQALDTQLGQLFAAVYISVRETRAYDLIAVTVPWVLGIALFGNAVTCLYVIIALQSAPTVAQAILGRHSATSRSGFVSLP